MNLRDWIIHHEGVRLLPYKCPAGKYTIGAGRNLTDVGITIEEAYYLLDKDIERCARELEPYSWYSDQPAKIQDALVNMCFNMGLPRLLRFKRMISCIEIHQYGDAAEEALDSRWARQVPSRARDVAKVMRSAC